MKKISGVNFAWLIPTDTSKGHMITLDIQCGKLHLCFFFPRYKSRSLCSIRFFHRSHNTVHFGGVFALKQWIISSLKHDTVIRVNNLYFFYVKNPKTCCIMGSWKQSISHKYICNRIRKMLFLCWPFLLPWQNPV